MAFRGNSSWETIQKSFKGKAKESDTRFFVPSKDADGKVAVVIRFLPSPDGSPIAEKRNHYYEGPGGKINTWCRYALGESCPICGASIEAHKGGDKARAQALRAGSKFISNILIVKDPNNPANEGKVFLYEVGAKIFKKIKAKTAPDNGLDEPQNIFDYFDGANFKLIGAPSSFVAGSGRTINYVDFEGSSFEAPSALTQEQAEAADEALYELNYWRDPANYKSYEELKQLLNEADGAVTNGVPSNPIGNAGIPSSPAQPAAPTASVIDSLAESTTTSGDAEGGQDWLAALKESVS